jgi:hypothetical protein
MGPEYLQPFILGIQNIAKFVNPAQNSRRYDIGPTQVPKPDLSLNRGKVYIAVDFNMSFGSTFRFEWTQFA